MKLLLVFLVVALGYGCSAGDVGVKEASGDTPVRYVICSAGEKNCFVAARFKDLDAYQSHKDWAEMLCESKSKPGVMICTRDSGQSIATAYCTL